MIAVDLSGCISQTMERPHTFANCGGHESCGGGTLGTSSTSPFRQSEHEEPSKQGSLESSELDSLKTSSNESSLQRQLDHHYRRVRILERIDPLVRWCTRERVVGFRSSLDMLDNNPVGNESHPHSEMLFDIVQAGFSDDDDDDSYNDFFERVPERFRSPPSTLSPNSESNGESFASLAVGTRSTLTPEKIFNDRRLSGSPGWTLPPFLCASPTTGAARPLLRPIVGYRESMLAQKLTLVQQESFEADDEMNSGKSYSRGDSVEAFSDGQSSDAESEIESPVDGMRTSDVKHLKTQLEIVAHLAKKNIPMPFWPQLTTLATGQRPVSRDSS